MIIYSGTPDRAEAEQIKQRLAEFLRDDLRLELSADKTLITHARTGAARFLGYEIMTQHSQVRPGIVGASLSAEGAMSGGAGARSA